MPGAISAVIIGFTLTGSCSQAFALDPFTVLAAGKATVDTVQTIAGASKDAAELAASISVISELADELGAGPGEDQDTGRVARKIQEVEGLAMEAGYTKAEAENIVADQKESSQKLSTTLGKLTRTIRLGKRIVALAGISSKKAAEISAVEQARGQDENRKILSNIQDHLITSELDRKKTEIEKEKAFQEQYKRLRSYVLKIAPHGNMALFPVNASIIEKAIQVYKSYHGVLLVLIGLIFFGRIVYYQFQLAPPEKYTDLIRDIFTCYFLMLAFPYVYIYMAECSEALSLKLGSLLGVTGAELPPDALPIDKSVSWWWFRKEMFPLILYAVTHVIFNFAISILIALGPIVILSGTMMNFSVSLPAYFVLLLFVWLWPAFWNVLGHFKNLLWEDSGAGSVIAGAVVFIFQLLSPLAVYSLLKNTHGGRVAHSAAATAGNAAGNAASAGLTQASSLLGKAKTGGAEGTPNGRSGGNGNNSASGSPHGDRGGNGYPQQVQGSLYRARRETERKNKWRQNQGILTGKEQYQI